MNKVLKEMTNEELQDVLDDAYEEWDRSHTIFSIADFEDCVRELTLRENM